MDDDFYEPLSNGTSSVAALGFGPAVLNVISATPLAILISVALAPLLIVICTRLLSGHPSEKIASKDGRSVWMLPYWVPILGHGFQL
jgi:hypothetical protein